MKMLRRYFISNSLDNLEAFAEQLQSAGVSTPQIQVLTSHDADLDHHQHVHPVESFMKTDIVHSTLIGAAVGVGACVLVLAVAYFAGWTEAATGWVPFVFLAVVMLGFCAWEGGFLGIQKPNYRFARFEQAIRTDKHVLFVDLERDQEAVLERVLKSHPKLEPAGSESPHRHWVGARLKR